METSDTSIMHKIYSALLSQIIQGAIQPDQVLNEKKLMAQFDVSRAPVREALIALCSEGVLYSIPYYGYKVTPLSPQDIEMMQEYRYILECSYMQRYWHKLTPECTDLLDRLMREEYPEPAEHDALTYWNKNMRFHLKLFSFYEVDFAYRSLQSAMTIQTRAYAQNRWEKWRSSFFHDDSSQSHRYLVECIRQNNIREALDILRHDILHNLHVDRPMPYHPML